MLISLGIQGRFRKPADEIYSPAQIKSID